MKSTLFFLLVFFACNSSKNKQFSTIQIKENVLNLKVRKFLSISLRDDNERDILIVSQKRSDTTTFYLFAGVKPDFKDNQILGCTYIGNVLIWIKGEKPDDYFMNINNSHKERHLIVDTIKEGKEIIKGHPLQWTIEFKGITFIRCKSNKGESCDL